MGPFLEMGSDIKLERSLLCLQGWATTGRQKLFFQIKVFFISTIGVFLSFLKFTFPKGSTGMTFSSVPRLEKIPCLEHFSFLHIAPLLQYALLIEIFN